jgi:hypothetical protein
VIRRLQALALAGVALVLVAAGVRPDGLGDVRSIRSRPSRHATVS